MRTTAQLRLMKALCTLQDESEKKAFLGTIAKAGWGLGKGLLTRAALPAAAKGGRVAGALGRYAVKNPLKTTFGALTAAEGTRRVLKKLKKGSPSGKIKLRSIY